MTKVRISILVDDVVGVEGLGREHGLSFWIEGGGCRVLFDTGGSGMFLRNAEAMGVEVSGADAIVLSHGHYDHTGGLVDAMEAAAGAKVCMHPAAVGPKYSLKDWGAKWVGMSESVRKAVESARVMWTEGPTEICAGVWVTGEVPRVTEFEDVGGPFFVDEQCEKPGLLRDDQAVYFECERGIVIVLGCAHAGVVNTLEYVSRLTGRDRIYAVIGGMHLLRAGRVRMENTIEALRRFGVGKLVPIHCTGEAATAELREAFGEKCLAGGSGTVIEF